MQQWNFSFFLFSAKRGGTSPNVQGKLSCWFDQLENMAFRLNISSFHKIPWRMHHQIDGNLLMRVRMAPWCDPCASVSPPWVTAMWMMHKKPCCDYIHMEKPWRWQQRILIVRLYSTIIEKSWIFSQKFLRHIIVTKNPGWFPFPQGGRSMIKLNASLWKMMTDGVDDKYHELVVQILSYILMYSYASRWPPW